jgi:hypothetical protein
MEEFFSNFIVGALIGTVISFWVWAYQRETLITYADLKTSIDNNISVRKITFDKFPRYYKNDYTDWKNLK